MPRPSRLKNSATQAPNTAVNLFIDKPRRTEPLRRAKPGWRKGQFLPSLSASRLVDHPHDRAERQPRRRRGEIAGREVLRRRRQVGHHAAVEGEAEAYTTHARGLELGDGGRAGHGPDYDIDRLGGDGAD